MNLCKTIPINNKIYNIYYDDFPDSPRSWENLGTIAAWHNNYSLGDEQPKASPEEWFPSETILPNYDRLLDIVEAQHPEDYFTRTEARTDILWNRIVQKKVREQFFMYPVFLYDHTNLEVSLRPFSCPWDSGQLGYIYVSRKKARIEFPNLSESKFENQVLKNLESEIEAYSQYMNGEVYGYVEQTTDGTDGDSCWGFYGVDDMIAYIHEINSAEEEVV